jgi:hypothetical protein
MSLIDTFQKWKLRLFLTAFFFIRIPSLNIIPFVSSDFLATQSLARVVFLGLFVVEVYLYWLGKSSLRLYIGKNRFLVALILLFFLELSLGIFYAGDTLEFLIRYKDVFLGIVMFFLGLVYAKNLESIAKVSLFAMVLIFFYQLIILLAPSLFKALAPVIYGKHVELVLANIARNRVYVETFDEAVVLLVIWWLYRRKGGVKNTYLGYVLLVLVGFFAFVSNFRSRLLFFLVTLTGFILNSLLSFKKAVSIKLGLSPLLISLVLTGFIASIVAGGIFGQTFIDRLQFASQQEDVETVFFRVKQLQEAWEMALENNFSGVGLGNFYEGLPFSKNYSFFLQTAITSDKEITTKGAAIYVHNIFGTFLAEGGVWAGILFLALTVKFLFDDYKLARKGEEGSLLLVFAFWGLFTYSLFNPFVPFSLQGLFWFVRGVITSKA